MIYLECFALGSRLLLKQGLTLFESLFFDPDRYDLSEVGRIKINARLDINVERTNRCLTKKDIKRIIEF